jgi:hypothetical protein
MNDCPNPTQQSGAVLTVALTALRSGFNVAYPGRDKGSDGWIGDTAHQDRTSGHNPDDTSGVSAEYSDSDTKQEVRAIDVDKDLKASGASMQDVIDRILATPNDTKRLKYIIFNRYQWSKSNDWRRTDYDGDNPHTEHAHFSGDPGYDEDGSPWSVESMGDDMPYSIEELQAAPWQYDKKGVGDNTDTVHNSMLFYFDEILDRVRALTSSVPPDLIARLDLILEAAQNDGQTSVVLPPDAMIVLEEILALLKTLPEATAQEFAERLQTPA